MAGREVGTGMCRVKVVTVDTKMSMQSSTGEVICATQKDGLS